MRILSVKRHLSADHSSSTYQFLAADKLTAEERAFVAKLTRREPKGRGLHIHYEGEREIPWEWHQKLLSGPYDVLVSESYDHWQAEFTVPFDETLHEHIQRYECPDDLEGFEVDHVQDRSYCDLRFHVDYGSSFFDYDTDAVKQLADLFRDIRSDIIDGDLSALWVVYETYCRPEADEKHELKVPLTENPRLLQSLLDKV